MDSWVMRLSATNCESHAVNHQDRTADHFSSIRKEYAELLSMGYSGDITTNLPTEPTESTSNLHVDGSIVDEIYYMLSILTDSKMGRSDHSKKRNIDFIFTWLESHSRIKVSEVSTLPNNEGDMAEAGDQVAGEPSKRDSSLIPVMSGSNLAGLRYQMFQWPFCGQRYAPIICILNDEHESR
jgi:hypothetical protein